MAPTIDATSCQRAESRESLNLINGFKATKITEAIIPIIATTIKSSIKVKPFCFFNLCVLVIFFILLIILSKNRKKVLCIINQWFYRQKFWPLRLTNKHRGYL